MSAVVFVGDVSAPASRQNTVASRVEGAPVGPVDPSQDGPWAAMAIVAIAAAGVAGFAIGQRARER
jgi:hypothetical protein